MEDSEYRVFVRIPIPRPPGFVDPPSFIWNAEKESRLWKVISRRTRGDINWTELAGVFQVDVPFLLQQAQFLYEKQLEELQLQMQRVNSSTSVLGQSRDSGESSRASGQLDAPVIPLQRQVVNPVTPNRASPSPLHTVPRQSPPRATHPTSPQHPQPSFPHRRKSSVSSPLVPDLKRSSNSSLRSSSSGERSNSSAAALRLYQQQEAAAITNPVHIISPPQEDDEEEPAFLPSSPRTSRPSTSHKQDTVPPKKADSNPGSDSFSDLSDASISKSALEEALEEHLRKGGSVAGSTMQGAGAGVRSIWKGKFIG